MATFFKLIVIICLLALFSCNNHVEQNNVVQPKTADSLACKPYYQFDRIEHYFLKIPVDKVWKIEEKNIKTEKEKALFELLVQYTPKKLSDTGVLKDIEKLGFVKKEISAEKFSQINEIFCQREHENLRAFACAAIFRDILVFKNENKIVGTAKICFDCDQNVITGTQLNTDEFGQSGDYEKLFKLLH